MKINITGIKETGTLYLLVFTEPKGFPSSQPDADWSYTMKIEKHPIPESIVVEIPPGIKKMSYGKLAVSAFLDVKGTGKLERNIFGIPVCPIGVSKISDFLFTPDFERCAVNVESETSVNVRLFRLI